MDRLLLIWHNRKVRLMPDSNSRLCQKKLKNGRTGLYDAVIFAFVKDKASAFDV